jgi:hypothetical protein
MRPNLLFNQYDLSLVLQGREDAVRQKVQALNPHRFLDESEAKMTAALLAEFRLNVPVLKRVEKQSDTEVLVPFEGDTDFFNVLPETFSSVPPRAEIGRGELVIAKPQFEHTVAEINRYLESLRDSAKTFNDTLEGIIATEIKCRKERLGLE